MSFSKRVHLRFSHFEVKSYKRMEVGNWKQTYLLDRDMNKYWQKACIAC